MKKTAPSKAVTADLQPFAGLTLECIHVPKTQAEFIAATEEILLAGCAGFDTESKPVFTAGVASDGPHVVQFALASKAFIFQVSQPFCRPYLLELLMSKQVLKVGFELKSDHGQIHAKFGVHVTEVLDLNRIFRAQGYPASMGARAAVGALLNQRFHKSKKTTTSNWALPELTPKQLMYAANDAYAAFKVFKALDLPDDVLLTEL